jgi:hypothetical protein
MSFGDWLADRLISNRLAAQTEQMPSINDVNPIYEAQAPFTLGTYETKETKRRHRKDIYTQWQRMSVDPSLSEALNLHVTAALGGDAARGDMVFMVPAVRYRGKGLRNAEMRKKVESRRRHLEPLINRIVFKVCSDALRYGDAYVRNYAERGVGVVDIICDEFTFPPLIQSFEQGGRTVGFQALESRDWERAITKLTTNQLVRMKMPRTTHVPQWEPVQGIIRARMLQSNNRSELPIIAAPVGGSFLFEVEEPWQNVHVSLASLNSQQIADSVKQMFLSVDMSGMPPEQQKKYKQGLQQIVKSHESYVREALTGGESVWATQWHVLPAWGEKQVLNPVGDIAGQRGAPLNIEYLRFNMQRLLGGIGIDMSQVGWADMLAGGLGDGAAFHTSASIARRSVMVRQALSQALNRLAALDWGYRYGEAFDEADQPWDFDFYSDQAAMATEQLTNQNNRMNGLMMTGQALSIIKEVGLSTQNLAMLLEKQAGLTFEEAEKLAKDLKPAAPEGEEGGDPQGQPPQADDPATDDADTEQDDGMEDE